MDNDRIIVFMDFATSGEASIVKGALESNNIHCFLSNENSPWVGGMLTNGVFGVRLHIFERDKEKAEELMELLNSATEEDEFLDETETEEYND